MMRDYEDDFLSQALVYSVCRRITRMNGLLMGIHAQIDETLHPEAFLSILDPLQEMKEIILDIERTFFSYRNRRLLGEAMPRSDFIHTIMKQAKEEKKSDD